MTPPESTIRRLMHQQTFERAVRSTRKGNVDAASEPGKHLIPAVADAIRVLVGDVAARKKKPRAYLPGDIKTSEFVGCFSDDLLNALVAMTFDGSYRLNTEAAYIHGRSDHISEPDTDSMTRAIAAYNPFVDPYVATALAEEAARIYDLVNHKYDPETGDRVLNYFDTPDCIKKHSLRLDDQWTEVFDTLVIRPLMVECLKGKLSFDSYEDFWSFVLGDAAVADEEDRLIFGLPKKPTSGIADRFLRLKDLVENISDEDWASVYGEGRIPLRAHIARDCSVVLHKLIHMKADKALSMTADQLLDIIRKRNFAKLIHASTDFGKRMMEVVL